jgi:hypothetical protein
MIGAKYEKSSLLRFHYSDLFNTHPGNERTRAGTPDDDITARSDKVRITSEGNISELRVDVADPSRSTIRSTLRTSISRTRSSNHPT